MKPKIILKIPLPVWIVWTVLIGASMLFDHGSYHKWVGFNAVTSIILMFIIVVNKNRKS